ncbi:MAG: hypothetical protein M1812_006326 [Candelaria pacifica]|nr:MAG: hypothetical protein M1812_006326 [Candelaria pacifica]
MSPTGLLLPNTSPRLGIYNHDEDPLSHRGVGSETLPSDESKVAALQSAHTTPEYLQFLEHPALRSFIRDFTGWQQEVILNRTLLRHNVPHGQSTGIHYDQLFLRASKTPFLTAWVPIGDLAFNGGGLMYLKNSTSLGKSLEADFNQRARHFTPEERISAFNINMSRDGHLTHDAETFGKDNGGKGHKWLGADYRAGDVVFHNPWMIHGAVANEDQLGRIRLSADLRFYQLEMEGWDRRWMQSWRPDDGI